MCTHSPLFQLQIGHNKNIKKKCMPSIGIVTHTLPCQINVMKYILVQEAEFRLLVPIHHSMSFRCFENLVLEQTAVGDTHRDS